MSFIFSRALVEEYSPGNYLDTEQCVPSNGSHTHKPCLWLDKTTAHSRLSRFGMTCKLLTESRGAELLTLCVEASRARTSQPLEKARGLTGQEVECGRTWRGSLAKFDPNTHSLKTAQLSLLGDLSESCVTLPRWGLMRNGECWELPTWEHHTNETVSGFWPTPTVCGNYNRKGASKTSGNGLATAVAMSSTMSFSGYMDAPTAKARTWPTATATAYKGWSQNHNRADTDDRLDYSVEREAFQPGQQTPPMRLNPDWVEWLMGWPIGHTALKPLATDKYQEWLRQHSAG